MTRVRRIAVVAALLLAVAARAPASAQKIPALAVSVDAHDYHALVHLGPVLANYDLADAALGGLPVRVRVHTDLWKDGFVDALTGASEWSAVLVYEPLREKYLVRAIDATGPARSFATYELARAAIEGEVPLRLRPTKPGRYYYTATLQIETLSVSDLQELERWLQGELEPAVSGSQSIPGAIGVGAKRLLLRVLGVPGFRIEARSAQFRIPEK